MTSTVKENLAWSLLAKVDALGARRARVPVHSVARATSLDGATVRRCAACACSSCVRQRRLGAWTVTTSFVARNGDCDGVEWGEIWLLLVGRADGFSLLSTIATSFMRVRWLVT